MSHVRTQIRQAVTAKLVGLATTGAHVFVNRVHPLTAADLPALIIRTDEEAVAPFGIGYPLALERTLTLRIEAVAAATAALDDTLDQILAEVEAALCASTGANTLEGLSKAMQLDSVAVAMDAESEIPVGRLTMSWTVVYFTSNNAPSAAI